MSIRQYQTLPSLPGLYARALRQALPVVGPGRHPESQDDAPTLRVEGVRVDDGHLAAYRKVCGFTSGPEIPVTYPQVLGFGLQLDLLTDPAFPFTALGAVHVANTIRTVQPVDPRTSFDLEVHGTPTRPHRRGRQLDIVTELRQQGELAWTSSANLLHIQGSAAAERDKATGPAEADDQPPVPTAPPWGPQVWRLSSGIGREYAAVSGDRNPIHLYDLTALPFGFRHHIAHGMWTMARCLAELANRLPDSLEVTVAFRKPVRLPGSVRFGARLIGDHHDFGLSSVDGRSAYVLGRVRG